jgi:hypothetical protein
LILQSINTLYPIHHAQYTPQEEAEAAKCPAIFDEKGVVVKFGSNKVGGGKCRHREVGKLTKKERREQQIKKMDYTDNLAKKRSKGGEGSGAEGGGGGGEGGGGGAKTRHAERMAKRRCMDEFREKNMAVFDHYGRVLKYGQEPLDTKCTKSDLGAPKCKVTQHERRKYRTSDEEKRQKLIVLDRQTEMDTQFGSQSVSAKKKKRVEKESRKRCGVYKEWSDVHGPDQSKGKVNFFTWLEGHWEDFQKLRLMQRQGNSNKRKVKSAYRHIALSVHPDKLPKQCQEKPTTDMMRDILTEADRLQEAMLSGGRGDRQPPGRRR